MDVDAVSYVNAQRHFTQAAAVSVFFLWDSTYHKSVFSYYALFWILNISP